MNKNCGFDFALRVEPVEEERNKMQKRARSVFAEIFARSGERVKVSERENKKRVTKARGTPDS